MFESILAVSRENLLGVVKTVTESVVGDRVKEYCQVSGVDFSKIRMRFIFYRHVPLLVLTKGSKIFYTWLWQEKETIILMHLKCVWCAVKRF